MPDAVQHVMLLRWSGIQMLDLGTGPAMRHFVPQCIRCDKILLLYIARVAFPSQAFVSPSTSGPITFRTSA